MVHQISRPTTKVSRSVDANKASERAMVRFLLGKRRGYGVTNFEPVRREKISMIWEIKLSAVHALFTLPNPSPNNLILIIVTKSIKTSPVSPRHLLQENEYYSYYIFSIPID